MIDFVLLISRQGKLRLSKWYSVREAKERARIVREVRGCARARGAPDIRCGRDAARGPRSRTDARRRWLCVFEPPAAAAVPAAAAAAAAVAAAAAAPAPS